MSFHETSFPISIAFGSSGGPRRKTVVATSGSGYEERNSQWANSRRVFNAGSGIKDEDDIYQVIEFFEERRGKLYGFRWKDRADWKSDSPGSTVAFNDQTIGTGDGSDTTFQLVKVYGGSFAPWTRTINKPVTGTVKCGVNGVELTEGVGYSVDHTTGIVTFTSAPGSGQTVTAGFEFDVPVRFDTDEIAVDLAAFEAGEIPDIPLIEVRL